MSFIKELTEAMERFDFRTFINENFAALNADKVEKETGKGLSDENFSASEKALLALQSGSNSGDETTSTILTKIGDGSKVSSAYLPSYVDDVVEAADFASLPATGETGKIYVTVDTGYQYRWSGSVYVEIKDSGETAASMGVLVNGSGAATPNDFDLIATVESGGLLKKLSWTNAKAFLKTYFDTLYAPIGWGGGGGPSTVASYFQGGTVYAATSGNMVMTTAGTLDYLRFSLDALPTGSSATVDVLKNGTSVLSAPLSITVTESATNTVYTVRTGDSWKATIATAAYSAGDVYRFVVVPGSSFPGANLSAELVGTNS